MSNSIRRPEHQAPPEVFYNETEAKKYNTNTHMRQRQWELSERAIELLGLRHESSYVLDLGCGSGLSGDCLTEQGHMWVGVDISPSMLDVARENDAEGDLLLGDLGDGLPFRAGSFDGAISISALQWLCNADKKYHKPHKRLKVFFSSLYACLSSGSRAVFQFYPENNHQIQMITAKAMEAGFTGGLVVDYPNSTKAKKYFLVLMTSGGGAMPAARGVEGEEEAGASRQAMNEAKRERIRNSRGKALKGSRDWIQEKKERRRRKGKETRPDSKFTGRKRAGRF